MKKTKISGVIFAIIVSFTSVFANLVTIFSAEDLGWIAGFLKWITNLSSLFLTISFIILFLRYRQTNDSLKSLAKYVQMSKMNQNIDISRLEKDLSLLNEPFENFTDKTLTDFKADVERRLIEQNYQLGVRAKEALNHIFETASNIYGGVLGYKCIPTLYLFINDFSWNIELGHTRYYKAFVPRDKIGEKTREDFVLTTDMYNIIKNGEVKNIPTIIEDKVVIPISTKTMSSEYSVYGFLEIELTFTNKFSLLQKEADIEDILKPLAVAISEELSYYIYSLHTQMQLYYDEANSSLIFGYESAGNDELFELDFLKELYCCLKI